MRFQVYPGEILEVGVSFHASDPQDIQIFDERTSKEIFNKTSDDGKGTKTGFKGVDVPLLFNLVGRHKRGAGGEYTWDQSKEQIRAENYDSATKTKVFTVGYDDWRNDNDYNDAVVDFIYTNYNRAQRLSDGAAEIQNG